MKSDPFAKTQGPTAKILTEGSKREEIVVRALQECQAAIDAGNPLDRDALLGKYPEIREELSACLEGLELMRLSASSEKQAPLRSLKEITPAATLGDFQIVQEIGKGGMGVVYEAEQLSVGRRVALKVLPYAAMLDKRQVARFQNEARAAATLEHTHIVPVYFVGNERGVYFYAMRLIEGRNLAEVLQELRGTAPDAAALSQCASSFLHGNVAQAQQKSEPTDSTTASGKSVTRIQSSDSPGSEALGSEEGLHGKIYFQSVARLIKQVAEALEFAHGHGVLHRDIKPANIMLDELGDAWVTDFGLARIESDGGMTMTGDLVGTLRYMSPEQTLAKRVTVDHRSDIYSLGATLYELLTLKPLFHDSDRASLLKKIAFEEPVPPSKIISSVPKDLETIVLKSLQKNSDDRYRSAQEFADDLERFLSYQPVLARRTPVIQRITKWSIRHPAVAGSIAVVTSVMLIATAVISLLIAKQESTLLSQEKEASKEIAASLGEKEKALTAANANLNEALNAIDYFLVQLSGESGQAIPDESPLRRDLISAAFETYNKLEQSNQMTDELLERKLMALIRAVSIERNSDYVAAHKLRSDAIELCEHFLTEEPGKPKFVFAKALLLGMLPTSGSWDDEKLQMRQVYETILTTVKKAGSAGKLFRQSKDNEAFFAEALVSVLVFPYGEVLKPQEYRLLLDIAVALVDQGAESGERWIAVLAMRAAHIAGRLGDWPLASRLMEQVNKSEWNIPLTAVLAPIFDDLREREQFYTEQLRRYEVELVQYPHHPERIWEYSQIQVELADLISQEEGFDLSVVENLEVEIEKRHPLSRRHILLGRLYGHLDEKDKQIHHYEQAAASSFSQYTMVAGIRAFLVDTYKERGDSLALARVYAGTTASHLQKRAGLEYFKLGMYDNVYPALFRAIVYNHTDMSVITWIPERVPASDPGWQHPEVVLGRKKFLEDCIAYYETRIEFAPEKGYLWHGLGIAQDQLGELEEAIKCYERALHCEENRELDRCCFKLAYAYLRSGNTDEYHRWLTRLVDLPFRSGFIQNQAAWLLSASPDESARNGELAVQLAKIACTATDWKYSPALDTLAAAYAECGDFESAVKWQKEAIEKVTSNLTSNQIAELTAHLDLFKQGKPVRE